MIIKAAGDWELDVLGVPFGSPDNLDSDGEYFSPRTRFHEDKGYELPPVVYYHGYDTPGRPAAEPQFIGKTVSREVRKDGVWYRVVLDKANELARRVYEAAKEGLARASSGSLPSLVRVGEGGEILHWPVAELSVFDTHEGRTPANRYAIASVAKMRQVYDQAGLTLPDDVEDEPEAPAEVPQGEQSGATPVRVPTKDTLHEDITMTPEEIQALAAKAAADAIAADRAERERAEAEKAAKAAHDAKVAEAAIEAFKAEQAKANRLPGGGFEPAAPAIVDGDVWKYDNIDNADLALLIGTLDAAAQSGRGRKASESAYKALALRLDGDDARKSEAMRVARSALKASGLKANEINQSTLSSYGDEWVGVAYSGALWEAIRVATFVAQMLPTLEVPAGAESVVIPLESTDPTWYKVAQAASLGSNPGGVPTNTVTASNLGTSSKTMTLAKLGARVLWTGELAEDSVLPYVAQLRNQLATSGAEYLESAIIDGDTDASATTNINDIAGTPASTDYFLAFDGFRKSCLVTTTANSRDGGVLAASDFMDTVALMGAGGINALDITKVGFILDPTTARKAAQLSEVLTRDVNTQATVETGRLSRIFGYDVMTSANIHRQATNRLANTAGKVDVDTQGNNTTGAILAVRWDQWQLGYRRRMTLETTRVPAADSTEIVALLRAGLVQRDTEASAISYNITV